MTDKFPISVDDFDAAMTERKAEDNVTQLRSSMSSAVGTNPDEHAKVLGLAKDTNLPVDVVTRNAAEVEKTKQLNDADIQAIFNSDPQAAKWMSNPENAKLVSDDFSMVGNIKNWFNDVGQSYDAGGDAVELYDLRAKENFFDLDPAEKARADALSQSLEGKDFTGGSLFRTATVGTANTIPQLTNTLKGVGIGAGVGGGIGFGAGLMLGPGAGVTTLGGAGLGAKAGSAYKNFMQQSGQIRDDLLKIRGINNEQLDPNVVRGASTVAGAISAGIDFIPFGTVAKQLPLPPKFKEEVIGSLTKIPGFDKITDPFSQAGIKKVMRLPGAQDVFFNLGKRLGALAIAGGFTEGAQQGVQIAAQEASKGLTDGQFTPVTFDEAISQIGTAAYQGATIEAVMGSPVSLSNVPGELKRVREYSPDQVQAHAANINQNVRSNVLFQRSPERFHELMKDLSGDDRFYVNGDIASETISSLTQEQQDALFAAVPDLRTELENASVSGGDVALSKADYASFIAPYPQADLLVDHIKLDPADTSVAERTALQEFLTKNPAAANMEALTHKTPAPQETYDTVERMVRKSMTDAGRDSVEARAVAPLFSRTIARFSHAFDQNAVDNFIQNFLGFRQQGENGETLTEGSNVNVLLGDLEKVQKGERIVGADEQTTRAITDFGDRLKTSGLTTEEARMMQPADLHALLYPRDAQPDGTDVNIPGITLEQGADGNMTATVGEGSTVRMTTPEQQEDARLGEENGQIINQRFDQIEAQRKILQQRERGSISFDPAKLGDYEGRLKKVIISFTERANMSTAAHEFSHWAVATHRYFADLAKQRIADGTASHEVQQIADDWEKLKEQVGATSDDFTVDQEEKVASLFEGYMREGHAPSESLRRLFTRFRDWLTKIYKDMSALGVEMNPEVRGIFDRWLASDEEIAQVQQKNSAVSQIAKNLGLPQNILDRVSDYVSSATMVAEESLYRKLSKEQKARETEAYQQQFDSLRKDVAEEFGQRREYMLTNYMKENGFKFVDGPGMEDINPDLLAEADGDNTVHPDQVSDLFGYSSGQELVRAMRKTPDFDEAVDSETRKRLLSKFPDMIAQGRIKNKAVDAIVNDRVLLALDLMIKEIGKSGSEAARPVSMKQFAKVMAQGQIAKTKMSEVNYSFRYDVGRDKELRAALVASRSGKPQDALLHLQRAMFNQVMFKSLEEFKDVREKATDLFARVNASDKSLAPGADIDFIGAARYILRKFGLGGQDFDINAWLADVQDRNPDVMQDLIGLAGLIGTPPKPGKELTISEFMDVYNSVDNIFKTARNMKEFERLGKKFAAQQAVGELVAQMGKIDPVKAIEGTQVYGKAKVRQTAMGLKAMSRRVEHWVNSMDEGYGGPFRKYVWEPIKEASVEYRAARSDWFKKLDDILGEHKKRLDDRTKISVPELIKTVGGQPQAMTFRDRMELIGFLLHTGNESNLEKLLGGYGISESSWQAAKAAMEADGRITAEDWKLVRQLWNFAEDLKPISQKAHKKLYGYRFDEIENKPFTTQFGAEAGGYWPAIIDTDQVDSKNVERALEEQKQFMLASTNKGFTKGRVAGYQRPLSTDLRLATNHIDSVLKFSHLEPAVRQVSRLMNDQSFKDTLKGIDSQAYTGMLMPWMQRAAQQITTEPPKPGSKGRAGLNKFWSFLRSSASAQAMMGNVLNAIQNVTGFSVSANKVGKRNFAKSLVRYIRNPAAMNEQVRSLSTEMRVRQDVLSASIEQDVNDIVSRAGPIKKTKQAAIKHGYIFQRLTQNFVDNVSWDAAYNKAIDDGMKDAEAIKYADQIVRTTQGSGAPEDISDIEAGSPGAKLFTMFYGYFNNIANLIGTDARKIMRDHGWSGSPKLLYMFAMNAAIPAIVSKMMVDSLRGNLPGDDDEDGTVVDDWLKYFSGAVGSYTTAMIPYGGQAMNAVINSFNDKPLDDRMTASPVISNIDTVIRFLGKEAQGKYTDESSEVRDGLNAVGFATGFPLGQLGKPLGFAANVHEGDEHPKNAFDYAKGVIAGPTPKK